MIKNEVSHPKSEVNFSWEVIFTVNYPPFKFETEMNNRLKRDFIARRLWENLKAQLTNK